MVLESLTFLKILGWDIEPTTGHISCPDERLLPVKMDEDERVIDSIVEMKTYNIMS